MNELLLYYPFHAGNLQLHTRNKARFCGTVYSVVAVLYLQFVLLVMLFRP